jgi:hypothetical protein
VVTIAPVEPAPVESAAPAPAASASAAPADGDKRAAQIAQELSKLDGEIVAVLGSSGGGAGGIGGLNLGAGGQGGGNGSLAGLAGPGPTPTVVGVVQIQQVGVKGGQVANATVVVAGMRAGFRRCYNRGLKADPTMKGSVMLTASIGPNGEVLSVSPSGVRGIDKDVVSCMAARVASAQFSPPDPGGTPTLTIPVTLQVAP